MRGGLLEGVSGGKRLSGEVVGFGSASDPGRRRREVGSAEGMPRAEARLVASEEVDFCNRGG